MVNSVKYFKEVCINNFLELSAGCRKSPKDIDSYVEGTTSAN